MPQRNIFHALGLHLHQPPANLQLLIDTNLPEAQQIIYCYDRIVRYAHHYLHSGHLHIGFSGLLLEQLQNPKIIDSYRQFIDIEGMLEGYRHAKNIEFISMGHYHPVFPLIPQKDWETHLQKEREALENTFGRAPKGFWPPEMAFSMEMIPALVKAGLEYVLIDASQIQPEQESVDTFQIYRACYEGHCISVVPINRDISSAQQSGLDPVWFAQETRHQVWQSLHPYEPRLLTTWSNGENDDWFRQEEEGFFGQFFSTYLEHVENGEYPIQPVTLSEFICQHPPQITAHIQSGAWNAGRTSGYGLSDWAGSEAQRRAVQKLRELSQRYWQLQQDGKRVEEETTLKQARQWLLTGQSSCFLFWGEAWIAKLTEYLAPAEALLKQLEQKRQSVSQKTTVTPDQPLVQPPTTSKDNQDSKNSNSILSPDNDQPVPKPLETSSEIQQPSPTKPSPIKPTPLKPNIPEPPVETPASTDKTTAIPQTTDSDLPASKDSEKTPPASEKPSDANKATSSTAETVSTPSKSTESTTQNATTTNDGLTNEVSTNIQSTTPAAVAEEMATTKSNATASTTSSTTDKSSDSQTTKTDDTEVSSVIPSADPTSSTASKTLTKDTTTQSTQSTPTSVRSSKRNRRNSSKRRNKF